MSSVKSDLTSSPSTSTSDSQINNAPPHQEDNGSNQSAFQKEREKLAESCQEFEEVYKKEERMRFKKYEAETARELLQKYFSKKDIYGGDIIEREMVIDDEPIRASRWLGTESYADPMKFLEQKFLEREGCSSASSSEAPTAKENQSMKKSD